jgi:hypothetical protein
MPKLLVIVDSTRPARAAAEVAPGVQRVRSGRAAAQRWTGCRPAVKRLR